MVTAGYWAFTVTDGAIRNEWGYVNRLMDLATVVARSIQSEV
jgi:glyceraldehyde-3-phosphate dehydrogenase/erythrose-4-phosphate dehydrogenase